LFDGDVGRILVFGAGGGGDVVSAAMVALKLREMGYETFVASAPWERYTVDRVPGPIGLDEIVGGRRIGEHALEVGGDAYAVRDGRRVRFQGANVARALEEPTYVCELVRGVDGLAAGLAEIASHVGADLLLAVDVGGDILALGYEEGLWSPLADQMALAAAYELHRRGVVRSVVAVAAIGADGELRRSYIIRRLCEVARAGGLLGSIGFGRGDLPVMHRLLEASITEAGRVIPEAVMGRRGVRRIRRGSRLIYIDVVSTIVFMLDVEKLYEQSRVAKLVARSGNIEEANEAVLAHGVITELEIERELARLGKRPEDVTSEDLLEIKRRILARIRPPARGKQ